MKPLLSILALVSFLVLPVQTHAMTQVLFPSGANISANGTRYWGFNSGSMSVGSTISNFDSPIPVSGTLSNLQVSMTAAPGTGESHSYTLMKNSGATALTCTVTDTNTTCSDTADTVTVTAGDMLAWRVVASATAVASPDVHMTVLFTGTTDGEALINGVMTSTASTANTVYMPIYGATGTTTVAHASTTMPTSGTVDNLYVDLSGSPGTGKSYTLTLYKNGTATSVTCTVSDLSSQCQDLSATTGHTVSFTAGDSIAMESTPTNTPTTARTLKWGLRFRPTTNGESPTFLRLSSFSNVPRWEHLLGGGQRYGTQAAAQAVSATAFTLKNLFFSNVFAGPTGSQSRTLTFEKNGSGTSLALTVNSSNSYTSDLSNTVSVSAGDLIDYALTNSGSPPTSSTLYYVAATVYVAPTISTPASLAPAKFRFFGGFTKILGGSFFIR